MLNVLSLHTYTWSFISVSLTLAEGKEEADGEEIRRRPWHRPFTPPPGVERGGAAGETSRTQGGDSGRTGRQTERAGGRVDGHDHRSWGGLPYGDS